VSQSEVETKDEIYELYRFARKIIERCEKDHADELKHFKDAVEMFDSLGRGYAERYEKEKNDDLRGLNE